MRQAGRHIMESAAFSGLVLLGSILLLGAGLIVSEKLLKAGADPNLLLVQQSQRQMKAMLAPADAEQRKLLAARAEPTLRQVISQGETAQRWVDLGVAVELQERPAEALLEYAKSFMVDLEDKQGEERRQAAVKALILLHQSDRLGTDPIEAAQVMFPAALAAEAIPSADWCLRCLAPILPRDEVTFMQAQIDEASGNMAQARRLWFATLSDNPYHIEAARKISSAARSEAQHREAARVLDKVLERHSDIPRLWHDLAIHRLGTGDLPGALAAMERAYEAGHWNPFYANRFADLLDYDGQRLRASRMRQQAREQSPEFEYSPLVIRLPR